MSDSRQDALELFRSKGYNEEDYDLILSESKSVTPIGLEPTSAIIVVGYLPHHSTRFAINLICGSSANVAFHFNPRLDRGYVVRNSKVKGLWAEEETCSPSIPVNDLFSRNSYFHIVIFCTSQEFFIAVNGQHFCKFTYRVPLHTITNFEYTGEVENVRFRKTTLWIYPDSKLTKSVQNLELSDQQPLTDNLKVPTTICINQELQYGAKISVRGRLKLLPHSFYINIQKSTLLYPHPEIALHLNPRFLYGNQAACVVMNCWTEGKWGREERHDGHLSLAPGREFFITIQCGDESYGIWLNEKMIGEFKHRMKPTVADTLVIVGDVVLHELSLSFRK